MMSDDETRSNYLKANLTLAVWFVKYCVSSILTKSVFRQQIPRPANAVMQRYLFELRFIITWRVLLRLVWSSSCYFAGVKESDTGLAHPGMWDLFSDKMCISSEQPLQVHNIGFLSLFDVCGPQLPPHSTALQFKYDFPWYRKSGLQWGGWWGGIKLKKITVKFLLIDWK